MRELTFLEAIREAQEQEMARDSRVFILGEDVSFNVYGSTGGLAERFGLDRVRDTPISEAGFAGVAVGAALVGMRPIVDFTVASFMYLAADPLISMAAKAAYMYGDQAHVPAVFRAALFYNGGLAAQHSDRNYAMFMQVPGLKIAVPSGPHDAKGLLKSAIRDDDPVLVFEDGALWGARGPVPEDDYLVPFGQAAIRREGSDVTVVAIGSRVREAIAAADTLAGEGISLEVIDPRTLVPLDRKTILDSVARTGRALVVDVGHKSCGVAGEIVATIAEDGFWSLRAPLKRLTAPDMQIPFSPALEKGFYPQAADIVAVARDLVQGLSAVAHEVLLPQWSMGMQDGQITRWLKAPGDVVAEGEVIAEVESSKVASELLADRDGVFLRALVEVDELVPVRTALCLIGTADELTVDAPAQPAAAPATASAASTDQRPAPPPAPGIQITPRARKLALDHGIDLAAVRGSGPGGRIVETDIEALIGAVTNGPAPYSLRQRRGRIAERLLISLRETAQLTLTRDIDVTELAAWREQTTPRPSWGDLISWALGRVLPQHPWLNATVQGDLVRPSRAVHLGFAAALDDGLVAPVIHNAHALSLADFAGRAADLTDRARNHMLQPGDVNDGTFTVSNLGGHGIDAFTPIINPPQVAILGLGRVREVPARDGAGIAWRQCFTASLTFDHRVTDGVPAAQMLADLAQFLGQPKNFAPTG